MRKFSAALYPFLTLLILVLCNGYSFSQELMLGDKKIDTGTISITADKLEFDSNDNTYKTEGNVEIVQEDRVLKADMVKLNQSTKEAEVAGNIILSTEEDILTTEKMEINLNTQRGTIYDGKLFFKKQNLHLTGKKMEKWDKDSYRIIDGAFTTCDGPSPPWKFTAKEVNVTIEGYATVKHATFYIKDIPVIYIPYLIYPAKIKRQTGFLIPSIGHSNDGGTEIKLPFYWVVSKNMDATFSLDYRSKRGIGEELEYRYVFSPHSFGNFYIYNMREKESYKDWKEERKGEPLVSGLDRTMFRYQHEQYFSSSFYARADITHVSDRDFFKDFGNIAGERSKEKLESTVFATKLWEKFSLNAEAKYIEDLEKEDNTTLQTLPRIDFTAIKQSIFGSPLFYSLTSAMDNFWREEGEKGQRIDIYPRLMYTFHTDYFELKPEIGGRETIYRFDEGEKEIHTREIYDLNLGITTAFQRIFNIDGDRLKKLKHSIKPELKYTFIPEVDQESLPNFDSVDRIYKKNSLTYSLISNLMGKIYEGKDDSYYHNFVRLKLSQSYNFSESGPPTDDFCHPFSPVSGELDLYPTKNTSLRLDGEYNAYNREFIAYNVLLGLKNERGDSIDLEYRDAKERVENLNTIPQIGSLNTRVKVKLSDSLDLNIENRYSTLEKLSLESILRLGYKAQCWGIRGEYADRVIHDEDRREQRFMVFFSLTGLSGAGD
ncbi:MAG: LPS assembly protein LptD [Pseudomonadota bacterium]